MMCLAFIPMFQRGEIKHLGVGFSQKKKYAQLFAYQEALGGRIWCLQASSGEVRAVDKVLSWSMEVRFYGEQGLVRIQGSWGVYGISWRGAGMSCSLWQAPHSGYL